MKLGIISGKHGDLILTSFGRLVYNAELKIVVACSHSSELRMIDVIKSDSGMSQDEQKVLINKLLDESELKKFVLDEKNK